MSICVGGDLGKMFRSGSGLDLVGFCFLGISLKVVGRQWTTLLDRDVLSCVMCRDLVCFSCIL